VLENAGKCSEAFEQLVTQEKSQVSYEANLKWSGQNAALMDCFALTCESAGDELKRDVCKAYLKLVQFGNEKDRESYEHAFFRAAYLKSEFDHETLTTIVSHLFALLAKNPDRTFLRCSAGLGGYIHLGTQSLSDTSHRLETAAAMVAKLAIIEKEMVGDWVYAFSRDLPIEYRKRFLARLTDLAARFRTFGKDPEADALEFLCEVEELRDSV